jgi:hypothetical protein
MYGTQELRKTIKAINKAARTAVRRQQALPEFLAGYSAELQESAAYAYKKEADFAVKVAAGDFLPMELIGRCADGFQRDSGYRIHAVPQGHGRSLCNKKPGSRSVGFAIRNGATITCPACLKAIERKK